MTTFSDLELASCLQQALEREGYSKPTPIQTKAIPPAIAGRDILGIAQTGTGKTAAFALPILHRLVTNRCALPRKGTRVLVLSPTRELASQIAASFTTYSGNVNIRIATVFGGVGYDAQIKQLARGVEVLVATPGRLIDHLTSGAIKLDQTDILVIDEADQMLDLGFVKPIRSIVSRLPRDRQTLFFSATMPASIAELARDFLREPKRVSVAPVSSTAQRVSQRILHVESDRKRAALKKLIHDHNMQRTLVFTRTKRGANRVAQYLEGAGITAAAIHGNKSQNQRERALEAFKDAKVQVLVATDIAARGIDIDGVSHVINYELPEEPEAYVHRIGRTARAGASGSAFSLCDRSELKYLRGIEKLIRIEIPSEVSDIAAEPRSQSKGNASKARIPKPSQPKQRENDAPRRKRPQKSGDESNHRTGEGTSRRPGAKTTKPAHKKRKRYHASHKKRSAVA